MALRPKTLLIFGLGYTGRAVAGRLTAEGWTAAATVRRPEAYAHAAALGVSAVDLNDPPALAQAVADVEALLITAAPTEAGCPAFAALAPLLERPGGPAWIGYLSSTGVYGDRGGRWVFEDSPLNARSAEGARRAAAEQDWLALGARTDRQVDLFRLPGIYGPGRSALDRVRQGSARRLTAPGHVFSRIHVADIACAISAALNRPHAGGAYNLCDDAPVPAHRVTEQACALLGQAAPPLEDLDVAALAPQAQRFYAESKRVSNAKAKAALGWRPAYPTYREGLAAILADEQRETSRTRR